MGDRRVWVTGLGPVTPIAIGATAFHEAQLGCRSGIRAITRFDAGDLPVRIAGEVDLPPELAPSPSEAANSDRFVQLGTLAAALAIEDAGLDLTALDRSRVGVVVGTGTGGVTTWEATIRSAHDRGLGTVSPRFVPMAVPSAGAASIAIRFGLSGPVTAPVTACTAGADALVAAHQAIVCGEADLVLAGGTEAPLAPTLLAGFAHMRALSRRNDEPSRASRPFSADRDGFVLAEGAAVLVLESAEHAVGRGARPYAALSGYGRTGDAYHMTRPDPSGEAAAGAVRKAMASAGLTPEDIAYVNAHGTATRFNDLAEASALRLALGDQLAKVAVSSTKSLTGHALGAAGAIEAVACVQAVASGILPPTANLDHADPDIDLDVIGVEPRPAWPSAVLSDSFAFGGHNVVLAFTAVR